jgi:hypothetical protein
VARRLVCLSGATCRARACTRIRSSAMEDESHGRREIQLEHCEWYVCCSLQDSNGKLHVRISILFTPVDPFTTCGPMFSAAAFRCRISCKSNSNACGWNSRTVSAFESTLLHSMDHPSSSAFLSTFEVWTRAGSIRQRSVTQRRRLSRCRGSLSPPTLVECVRCLIKENMAGTVHWH